MAKNVSRRAFVGALATGTVAAGASIALADGPRQLREPVYRVSNAKIDGARGANAGHALDPALQLAGQGLNHIRAKVNDYTATIVKRERINGKLMDYEYMFAKIRNRKVRNNQVVSPFSVYLRFEKPKAAAGREVLYIEGQNNDKLLAHEGKNSFYSRFGSVWLKPDGAMAMKGQLYPLTDIGLENLVSKLIERGNQDKRIGPCEVDFRTATVDKRHCEVIEVRHPKPDPKFEFCIARIFFDRQLLVPIRYAAYTWPRKGGTRVGGAEVMEEYTYTNLKLNVGLTDEDFSKDNAAYNF